MKGKSHQVLKSITLLTKPATAPTLGVWADKQVAVNLIGADTLAIELGIGLIRKGVSILRIYDPTQMVHRHDVSSPTSTYLAIALAKLLGQEVGNPQTKIIGYPFRFDPVSAFPCDLAIVSNANYHLRAFDSDYLQATKIPYLSVALSSRGEQGTILVHRAQADIVDCAAAHAAGDGVVQSVTFNTITDVPTHLVSLVGEAAESIVAGRDPPWICAQVRTRGEGYVQQV